MIRSAIFLACALASATQSETPQTFEAASIKQIVLTPGRRLTPLNGGPGTIYFHAPSMSLVVRQTSEFHLTHGLSIGQR